MKACKREEACSFTTKANHEKTECKKKKSDFQMMVSADEWSPG